MNLIHQLFEQQAGRSPEAIALADGAATFTYADLNAHTSQMASWLQQAGVGPEVTVGCYLSSPAQVVVVILAVLKAGGLYLLLDHHLPDERLRYMVQDAEPELLIHDQPLPAAFEHSTRRSVELDELRRLAVQQPNRPMVSDVRPENAAYIAYTSGSTGRPKGVVITHRATVNHAQAFANLFRLTTTDRVPLMAPAAFDMATEEIVPPLLSGCTLVASTSTHASMPEFTKEITDQGYTILNIPAPLWQLWTEYLHDEQLAVPPSLRLVITGSDKIHTSTLEEWKAVPGARDVAWAAAYGTTETTVTSSFYLTGLTDDLHDELVVPIGTPIANTQFYIVDESGRLVAEGATGELCIGGRGLARGYHNLPHKTRRYFTPNPFSDEAGARLYHTGDLARRRPDGTVVCLGRRDFQVKVNGLRIEPGEIEAILTEHPDVHEAVVILQQEGRNEADKRLVAFVEPRAQHSVKVDGLRAHVADRLHPLMLPHAYMVLEQLPLNANGKIDRRALERYTGSQCLA